MALKIHPYLAEIKKSYIRGFKAVIIFSFIINLLMLSVPVFMIQIYDKVIPNNSSDTLYFLSIAMLIGLFTLSILDLLRGKILARLGRWFSEKLGGHLMGSSVRSTLNAQGSSSASVLMELGKLGEFATSPAVTSLLDIPWVPLYIAILFFIHPVIGFIVLGGAILLFVLAIVNELTTRQLISAAEELSMGSMEKAASYLRNADVIEAMGMREAITARWGTHQQEAIDVKYTVDEKRSKITSAVKFIRLILQISVMAGAALLILAGELTPGATIATILMLRNTIGPLEGSITAWKSVVRARRAFDKVNESLYNAPVFNTVSNSNPPSGAIAVENLFFQHQREDGASILQNLNFSVAPGESMVLTGSSGSGKSTLCRLLTGLARPVKGHVSLGGQDIGMWDSQFLGDYLGYLPQSIELFWGTVAENIARMGQIDPEAVVQAAQQAGVHDLITSFPKGYATQIGHGGGYLSGGQRQRIGLARALYRNPPYIFLDEPDAHLDVNGTVALVKSIRRLTSAGSAIVLVTHHDSIHRFVDKIFDVERGDYVTYLGGDAPTAVGLH